jgi:hypothetical protein
MPQQITKPSKEIPIRTSQKVKCWLSIGIKLTLTLAWIPSSDGMTDSGSADHSRI